MRSHRAAIVLSLAALTSLILPLRLASPAALGFYPPCPVHRYLGLLCPGCGATRALGALLHGRLHQAWHLNPLFLLLLPLALAYAAELVRRLGRNLPDPYPKPPQPVTCALLALTVAFTVARNLAR